MKKILGGLFVVWIGFTSCGNNSEEKKSSKSDSVSRARLAEDDTLPHEVRLGNADYAYKPDTCIKKLILGNADSWDAFYKENGAAFENNGDGKSTSCYFNSQRNEKMLVSLVNNAADRKVVYSFIIQKYGDLKAPELPGRIIPASDLNFISGNGIYIGMSQEYVMHVYMDQTLTQRQFCDTTFLVYKPTGKDHNFYKRFNWQSYSATYKFVDNELKRMEYLVNPSEFEKH